MFDINWERKKCRTKQCQEEVFLLKHFWAFVVSCCVYLLKSLQESSLSILRCSRFSQRKIQLSHAKKKTLTFHYTGCLKGILIRVYHINHINHQQHSATRVLFVAQLAQFHPLIRRFAIPEKLAGEFFPPLSHLALLRNV